MVKVVVEEVAEWQIELTVDDEVAGDKQQANDEDKIGDSDDWWALALYCPPVTRV